MSTALLQLPQAITHPAEAALGFRLPLPGEVSRLTESQVHALVEVVSGFAIAAQDVIGHRLLEEGARLVQESLIVVGQLNS